MVPVANRTPASDERDENHERSHSDEKIREIRPEKVHFELIGNDHHADHDVIVQQHSSERYHNRSNGLYSEIIQIQICVISSFIGKQRGSTNSSEIILLLSTGFTVKHCLMILKIY